MDAFQFKKELLKSSCPVKKKSPSHLSREEEKKNKFCLNISNQVSVEESEDKKSTENTKASKVTEEVFKKSDKSKNLFVEETVDKKFSDKMKASEILEEVFIKCVNWGENFKTTQGLKDHYDQAHNNLPKNQKYKCEQCD